MAKKEKWLAAPIRETMPASAPRTVPSQIPLRTHAPQPCEDCRASTAFLLTQDAALAPSFNMLVSFDSFGLIPAGKRAVIEMVTAAIIVPSGEWARLRMYTSLGSRASNLDLFVTFQGNVGGSAIYIATHPLRVYSDAAIDFNINRDNGTTAGSATICISGYVAG